MRLALFILVLAACNGASAESPRAAASPVRPTAASPAAATPGSPAPAAPAPQAIAASAPAPAAQAQAPVAQASAEDGEDFISDARLLYRIAACGPAASGDAPLDPSIAKIVDHHCKIVLDQIAKFRDTYFDKGRAWFDKVEPADLPTTVVYPFGGGDLLSALVAFPNATEITTVSLELAGDPRRIATLPPSRLATSLSALRLQIGGLISVGSNTSLNLSAQQQNDLPGQVSSFLLGLVAGGYEPVSMRYFTLDTSGNIHYLTADEIAAADADAHHKAKRLKHDWESPNFSAAFSNVEIRYRKIGESQIRVHRHIAWNLGDPYMKAHPELLAHLEQKGKVAVLVKGASYLLWRGDFSRIRNYLLDHLAWMLSDSTGIPPAYARRAHMTQTTYGRYDGAFIESCRGTQADQDFVELWQREPHRGLPFRFGYVDMNKQAHLLVTKPRT